MTQTMTLIAASRRADDGGRAGAASLCTTPSKLHAQPWLWGKQCCRVYCSTRTVHRHTYNAHFAVSMHSIHALPISRLDLCNLLRQYRQYRLISVLPMIPIPITPMPPSRHSRRYIQSMYRTLVSFESTHVATAGSTAAPSTNAPTVLHGAHASGQHSTHAAQELQLRCVVCLTNDQK